MKTKREPTITHRNEKQTLNLLAERGCKGKDFLCNLLCDDALIFFFNLNTQKMKTRSFFTNSSLITKHLLLLAFFLFTGNSIKAQCPDWNDCISLINSDGCTHTFLISIEGEGAFENDPDFDVIINWNFAITIGTGTITSASFIDPFGYMAQNGVSLNVNPSSLNIFYANINQLLDADKLIGDQIFITVVVYKKK